tara:strand:+ start:3101 stop:4366 length:1266 start_codon:yes stop_codon:yes gene_type:complete
MSKIIAIDKSKPNGEKMYLDYSSRLLKENVEKSLCMSDIKNDFLHDSLEDADYLFIHTFQYDGYTEIRGFACVIHETNDEVDEENDHLYLKLICNSKFHSMETRIQEGKTKRKGTDIMKEIIKLGEKLKAKYIKLDAIESVISYYYNLGFRFENREHTEHVKEGELVNQLRMGQLLHDDAKTTRAMNEIVARFYPGFYSEAKQREFGEGDGTRKEQAMEYGIPMIYNISTKDTSTKHKGGKRHTRKHKISSRNRHVQKQKHVPRRYIPTKLTQTDKKKQREMLKKSRRQYKEGKYYTRKRIKSFKSKPSNHVTNAKRLYKVNKLKPSRTLAIKTGCSLRSLREIVKKGEGAYFSSGSRPNQTAQSWGYARLASSITSGKSAAIDYNILEKGCKKTSKALRLAKKSRKKHGYGNRKTVRVKL